MSLAAIATLLQVVLSLLVAVQANPNLPQSARDSAVQTAQQVILQATTALSSAGANSFTVPCCKTSSGVTQTTVNGMNQVTQSQTQSVTFSASPTSGTAPLAVVFTSNQTSGMVDFGDGSTGNLEGACTNSIPGYCAGSISHTYTSSGTYTAKLTQNTQCGLTNSIPGNPIYCPQTLATVTISVTNIAKITQSTQCGVTNSVPGNPIYCPQTLGTVATDKSMYVVGTKIKATWSNTSTPATQDWIGIVSEGGKWSNDLGEGVNWAWVTSASGSATLTAPNTTGRYQIVYFLISKDPTGNYVEKSRSAAFDVGVTAY